MAYRNMSPRSQQLQTRTLFPCTAAAPCRHRHKRQKTITSILATPVQAQNQKDSTLQALQSALTITAVKTPYLENGRIDLDSYDKLIEQQVLGGVEGVVVGGTTGEGQVGAYTCCPVWDSRVIVSCAVKCTPIHSDSWKGACNHPKP